MSLLLIRTWRALIVISAIATLTIGCGTDSSGGSVDDDNGPGEDSGLGDAGDAGSDAEVDTSADGADDTGGADGGADASDDGGADAGADAGDDTGDTSIGPQPGGGPCGEDADCPNGTYCELSFPPAFCAPDFWDPMTGTNCATDDDCVLEDSDGVFCCASLGERRTCTPAPDGVCGAQDNTQGEECDESGQSDCRGEDHYCIFGNRDFAYCSQFCNPLGDDCPNGSYCLAQGAGFGLCLEYGDIEPEEPCAGQQTECGEDAFCIENETDDPYAYCAETCDGDFDCADDEQCSEFGVCSTVGDGALGDSCVEDRFSCGDGLICLYWGTRVAECSQLCERQSDCDAGFFCNFFDEDQGVCREDGTVDSGEFCGNDPFGCSGYCTGGYDGYDPGAYCVEQCDDDSDCPDNAYCFDFGEDNGGRYCQADGGAGQGDSCALDPLECERDHYCIDYGTSTAYCASGCTEDSQCESGSWCTGSEETPGACIPFGEIEAGESCDPLAWECEPETYCAGGAEPLCFSTCTDDEDSCPNGQFCLDPNEDGVRWCYPTGDLAQGESCVGEPYGCEYPLFCADSASEQARCSSGCERDADCPTDEWCFTGPGGGYCRPSGDSGPMGSCEGDVYACEEGLVCLLGGANGAFCADECTGFASTCGDGEACRFVGFTRSFCMDVGDAGHGDSCADDQFACDANNWCVNAGTENAVCVQTCSLNPDSCPENTSCQFLQSGLAVCISAGLSPDNPLNPGGSPF